MSTATTLRSEPVTLHTKIDQRWPQSASSQLKSMNQPNPLEKELPPPPQAGIYATSYQKSLRLMEIARSRIICQRLCEDWDGVEPELKRYIDFEKRLWALTALKRVGDGFENKYQDRRPMGCVGSTILTSHEPKTALTICDALGMFEIFRSFPIER